MSKKSKRMKAKKNIAAKQSGTFNEKSEKPAAPVVTQTRQYAVKDVTGIQESQYRYIMPEVIRICIISGIIFVAIIALSYFIK
jgi:hypothetical protein